MSNLQVLNALLYVAEHGCKWRGLPKHFGNWHTIYTRMNRWSKAGVLDRVFARLQQEQIIAIKFEAVSLDSTTVKVHPDGTGALKKTDRKLGIYEYRARHYDRTIGRFISEDPIRFKGGLDFYAYTKNDPISYRDPLDLCGDCHVTCIRIATLLSVVQCLL